MKKNSNLELSIQVSLNGLSFSILDRNTSTIKTIKHLRFDKRQTPFYLLDKLQGLFNTENVLNDTFSKVNIIHKNELTTLVPKALFKEDCLADYLKFNAKILQTDFITYDDIVSNDSVNVYVPYVNINNFIFERYGEFTYKHATTILIEQLLATEAEANETKMVVNVHTNTFEVFILKDGQLHLYNTFEYTTKEDFIYYILFTAEQLQLDPETLQLVFYGAVNKDDEIYTIAYKYIRHVSFGNRMDSFVFENEKPKTNYSDYTLLKSF